MEKKDFVLKVLSIIDMPLTPIQIQKMFFLLEKRLGKEAAFFNFEPYMYGPYDRNLNDIVNEMVKNNEIDVSNINGVNNYQVNKNLNHFNNNFFDEKKAQFIQNLASFIKQKTFKELCFSIYEEFPEMKVNSVFNNGN